MRRVCGHCHRPSWPGWLLENRVKLLILAVLIACGSAVMAQVAAPVSRDGRYFPLTRVSSVIRPFVIASGDRLQKPGAERLTANGSIQYNPSGATQATPVQITWQLPLQIRLDRGSSTVIYDGKNGAQRIPAGAQDADTIETLVEDSLEGFLRIQATGGSTRFLGEGFRDDSVKASATFFDIVQVLYPATFRGGQQSSKAFYFDSKTKLLARIEYEPRPGNRVQVNLSDWRNIQGTKLPFLVERRENNIVTMKLALSVAQTAQGTDDLPFTGR